MKKSKTWTKRKLFTFQFKGRHPRGLLWRKSVYEEWFEYGRLHQLRGGTLPKQFGRLLEFQCFEDWWRHPKYGFELFCEPYVDTLVNQLKKPTSSLNTGEILIKVNLNGDRDKIISDFKRLLKGHSAYEEYSSQARFQPSRSMQHIRVESLQRFRKTFLLTEQMKQKEVAKALGILIDNDGRWTDNDLYQDYVDSKLRYVQRHRRSVLLTFKNLEKGIFP